MLTFLKKFWVVAVLEVPDSPTRTTGLLIRTICSNSQPARVVSTVGTGGPAQAGRHTSRLTHYIPSRTWRLAHDGRALMSGIVVPRMSMNFLSGSWTYLVTRDLQGSHFLFTSSKWKSYRVGR